MSSAKTSVVILGAGVTGLTTATELLARHQHPQEQQLSITLVAKYFPGDLAPDTDYCSTQAGAMWMSTETEFNRLAAYEKVAYARFLRIAEMHAESGVRRLPLRRVYGAGDGDGDARPEGKTWWFEQLVGGIQAVSKEDLPEDAAGGVDWTTFVINPSVYLTWLYTRLLQGGVTVVKRSYDHIDDLIVDFPDVSTVFNCTGLGARNLGGVEDEKVYPTKGQTILLSDPKQPLERMYLCEEPSRFGPNEFAHVLQRPLGGGVIIGGVRLVDDWDASFDLARAERIKQRACRLCPELGRPEDLQVIRHLIGLRPSRQGGVRIEKENRNGKVIVHNYGAGGSGYQASWGMAGYAVDLFTQGSRSARTL